MYVCTTIYYIVGILYVVVSFPNGRHRNFLTKYYYVCRSQLHSDDGGFFCPLKLCYYISTSNSERYTGE